MAHQRIRELASSERGGLSTDLMLGSIGLLFLTFGFLLWVGGSTALRRFGLSREHPAVEFVDALTDNVGNGKIVGGIVLMIGVVIMAMVLVPREKI